jgi:hypothetical protein
MQLIAFFDFHTTQNFFPILTQAYAIYSVLAIMLLFNMIASVLLYALLCCIYATMFGVVVYFCPKLISLFRPSLRPSNSLVVRLVICTGICILIFAFHTIYYARLVVAPPREVYWWWQYGTLLVVNTYV